METITKTYTQPEIKAALQSSFQENAQFVASISDEDFYKKKNEKWSIAENFDHLILSNKPLASGLKKAKIFFRAFGTAKEASKKYTEIVAIYEEALLTRNPTNNPYISKDIESTSREKYLSNWNMIGEKYQERLDQWTEKDLDKYRIPHPVLGKLTVREMMFFTINHNFHHLKIMKKYLEL